MRRKEITQSHFNARERRSLKTSPRDVYRVLLYHEEGMMCLHDHSAEAVNDEAVRMHGKGEALNIAPRCLTKLLYHEEGMMCSHDHSAEAVNDEAVRMHG